MAGLGGGVKGTLRIMLFYSDYGFKSEGLRVIKKMFDQRMSIESIYAKIDYDPTEHCFVFMCEASGFDDMKEVFDEMYKDTIKKERADGYDWNSELIAKIPPLKGKDESQIEAIDAIIAASKEDAPFDFQAQWQCSAKDESIDEIIPQEVLLQIEAITLTSLIMDQDDQVIYILGRSPEDCTRVARKLDVLRKYYYLTCRFFHHVIFAEEKTDFEACMPILSEIHENLARTTLLDPFYAGLEYEDLAKTRMVRCCLYSNIRGTYTMKPGGRAAPAVPEDSIGVELRQWSRYRYSGRGDESWKQGDGSQHSVAELTQTAGNVRNWSGNRLPGDPSRTAKCLAEYIQDIDEQKTDNLTDFDSGNLIDLDTGGNNALSLRRVERDENTYGPTQGRRAIRRSQATNNLREGTFLKLDNSYAPNNLLASPFFSIEEDENTNHPDKIDRSSQCSQSLIDSDITETERRDLDSIKFKRQLGPGGLRNVEGTMPTIREAAVVKGRFKTGDSGKLVANLCPSAAEICERREEDSESQPVFVPFENLCITEEIKNFTLDMEDKAHMMLTNLRSYGGSITLKCHLGRLLVKPLSAAMLRFLERRFTYPAHFLKSILDRSFDKVDFTKIITTVPAEIDFIHSMKIEETNQQIWGNAVEEWAVTYEFVCCEHIDHEMRCATSFILEIDASSFATRVKSPAFSFGKILVHCSLRNWDYVIDADGARNLEEQYGDIAHAIKDSIYIAPGAEQVSMTFELHRDHRIHFQSIRVRRRIQHKSYDGRTLLNIVEVHKLDCKSEELENGDMFFVSESGDPNSVWYEVDMESVEAKIAFRENLTLEIGDETDWKADLLVQSGVIVKDLCIPANYIIANMDGVGFYDDNGTNPVVSGTNIIDPSILPEEQRPGYHFW